MTVISNAPTHQTRTGDQRTPGVTMAPSPSVSPPAVPRPVSAATGPTVLPPVAARATGVSRTFGDETALDRVDLTVRQGELVGLLGPNGAGKSTLISLFTGLRRPSAGTVEILGGDPRDPRTRVHMGVTPQDTGLPDNLKVKEVVDFVAAHFPDPAPRQEILTRFGLDELADRQTGGLSGGQKRRLTIALSFVGRPSVVFLDEPTTGLDVEARRQLWAEIAEYHRQGGTVVLTSHYLEEIEALAQRVVVMSGGRVIADDDLESVRGVVEVARVSFRADRVPDLPGVASHEVDGDLVTLFSSDPDQLVRDLVASRTTFSGLEIRPTTLEEAFLAIA